MAVVAGIVLAAGSSLRMGEPKQLLRYRGSTLLNLVIATAEASRLDHVVVVVGANAQAIEDSNEAGRATVVHNPDFQMPNMTSVVCGARSVEAEAFLTLPADMPGISAAVINAVIDRWAAESPWAAMGCSTLQTGLTSGCEASILGPVLSQRSRGTKTEYWEMGDRQSMPGSIHLPRLPSSA